MKPHCTLHTQAQQSQKQMYGTVHDEPLQYIVEILQQVPVQLVCTKLEYTTCTIYTNVHKYMYLYIYTYLYTLIYTSEQMPSISHNGDTGWGEGPLVSLPGKSLS